MKQTILFWEVDNVEVEKMIWKRVSGDLFVIYGCIYV